MDTISLKKYIYEQEKIEFILDKIGCHDITYHPNKEYYACANIDGDNTGAINIKNNQYLSVVNWTRQGFKEGSDIITLVEYNKQLSFVDAVKYLHSILGLEYKWQKKTESKVNKENPSYIFEKVRSKKRVDFSDIPEIHVLNSNLLDDYIPLLHIDWFKEGIMPWAAKRFGLAYSYKRKRVIIPMRYWLTGELLGVNARTTIANYAELGIKKYYITPSYQKSLNIYGYYENQETIKKAGYVVVYESEKSTLKRYSMNDGTGVSVSGHTISDEQASILIGLNVDIIISFDNDVPIQEIRYACKKFYLKRNVYYTYDKWGLLGEKDSIADKPQKIFNFLLQNKIKYDASEDRKYMKEYERRK